MDENSILEREIISRHTAGVKVTLVLADPMTPGEPDELWLLVSSSGGDRAVKLTYTNWKDAFEHPALYVDEPDPVFNP